MMMRGLISGLIRRSAEHQLRNTTYGLRKFIASANILTAIPFGSSGIEAP